jgi:hypothetical protein
MHRALLIEEVVFAIINDLDFRYGRGAVVTLARTCRAFSEPALNVIWARPSLWCLAQLMPRDIWAVNEHIPAGDPRRKFKGVLVGFSYARTRSTTSTDVHRH